VRGCLVEKVTNRSELKRTLNAVTTLTLTKGGPDPRPENGMQGVLPIPNELLRRKDRIRRLRVSTPCERDGAGQVFLFDSAFMRPNFNRTI
jgi:hypothetical protein